MTTILFACNKCGRKNSVGLDGGKCAGCASGKLFLTEFPDFDPATMPSIPAGFEDVSWHNDTCPSFLNEAAGLILFVEFANPAIREVPDVKRFSLNVWENGNTGTTAAYSDNWNVILAVIEAWTKPTTPKVPAAVDAFVAGATWFRANGNASTDIGKDVRAAALDYIASLPHAE